MHEHSTNDSTQQAINEYNQAIKEYQASANLNKYFNDYAIMYCVYGKHYNSWALLPIDLIILVSSIFFMSLLGMAIWLGPGSWGLMIYKVVGSLLFICHGAWLFRVGYVGINTLVSKWSDVPQEMRRAAIATQRKRLIQEELIIDATVLGIMAAGLLAPCMEYATDALCFLFSFAFIYWWYNERNKMKFYTKIPESLHAEILTYDGMLKAYNLYYSKYVFRMESEEIRGVKFHGVESYYESLNKLRSMLIKMSASIDHRLEELKRFGEASPISLPSMPNNDVQQKDAMLEQMVAEVEVLAEVEKAFEGL